MSEIIVEKIEPEDDEVMEEWIRVTDNEDIFGVSATRFEDEAWPWNIFVSAAEFVRTEPLESQLHAAIDAALAMVAGVTEVVNEDREVWILKGNPTGEDLVRACSVVLDEMGEAIQKAVEEME